MILQFKVYLHGGVVRFYKGNIGKAIYHEKIIFEILINYKMSYVQNNQRVYILHIGYCPIIEISIYLQEMIAIILFLPLFTLSFKQYLAVQISFVENTTSTNSLGCSKCFFMLYFPKENRAFSFRRRIFLVYLFFFFRPFLRN